MCQGVLCSGVKGRGRGRGRRRGRGEEEEEVEDEEKDECSDANTHRCLRGLKDG